MGKRRHIWWEILRPSWRWGVLVPLALLGGMATIRDDIVDPGHPELFRLAYWLPHWPWQNYALIGAVMFVFLILESAYRAIKGREDIIIEIASIEETISQLVQLQASGRRCYSDTDHSADDYNRALEQWEAQVTALLENNFSVSELHSFQNFIFANGSQYVLPDSIPSAWLAATENQRIQCTQRIMSLDRIIEYGSGQFLGPKLKLAEMMEARK